MLSKDGKNGKYAIRIFVYIIRMYSNIRIEKSSMFSLRFQLGEMLEYVPLPKVCCERCHHYVFIISTIIEMNNLVV